MLSGGSGKLRWRAPADPGMPDPGGNAAMSKAYSVYWPRQRWRHAAGLCQRLAVLFDGPHHAEPSFRRAAVDPGHLLYPIGVCDQVLYVLGQMRV